MTFGKKTRKGSKLVRWESVETNLGTLFTLFFGRALDKMSKKWQYLAQNDKNADFGPNLAVFGPKILIFIRVSKTFGTNITENHLDNLSALFFGQAIDQMGQK